MGGGPRHTHGLVTIAMYVWHPTGSPLGNGSGWDHMALPWSIPFYTFGAIFLEFLLRLAALCILFWFVHVVVLRRRLRAHDVLDHRRHRGAV